MSTFLRIVVLITILNVRHLIATNPPCVVDAGDDINTTTQAGLCSDTFVILATTTGDCVTSSLICSPAPNAAAYTFPVGMTTVTCTAMDQGSGNNVSDSRLVTVNDIEEPHAMCQNINVELDANGSAQIEPDDIDNDSTDNCDIASMSIDIASFTCDNVGDDNTVTLTVVDTSGNNWPCPSTITVIDSIAPVAICKDITIQLDANGDGEITAGDIDNGSTDNCDIENILIDKSSFICGDLGTNMVTLTVLDVNGNQNTCQSIVTVEPSIACTKDPTKHPTNGPTQSPTIDSSEIGDDTSNSSENVSKMKRILPRTAKTAHSTSNEADFTALFVQNEKDHSHVNQNVDDKKYVYIKFNANDNTLWGILVLFCCVVICIYLCYLCRKCINEHKKLNFDGLKEITISK